VTSFWIENCFNSNLWPASRDKCKQQPGRYVI